MFTEAFYQFQNLTSDVLHSSKLHLSTKHFPVCHSIISRTSEAFHGNYSLRFMRHPKKLFPVYHRKDRDFAFSTKKLLRLYRWTTKSTLNGMTTYLGNLCGNTSFPSIFSVDFQTLWSMVVDPILLHEA